MRRVTGIGGVFFKAANPNVLAEWYRVHLGMDVEAWGGVVFRPADAHSADASVMVWCAFADDTSYFAPSTAPFMINYRVEDLGAVLAALRIEGCQVMDEVVESEHGKFGWVIDPEGNKVELWQPPQGTLADVPSAPP